MQQHAATCAALRRRTRRQHAYIHALTRLVFRNAPPSSAPSEPTCRRALHARAHARVYTVHALDSALQHAAACRSAVQYARYDDSETIKRRVSVFL